MKTTLILSFALLGLTSCATKSLTSKVEDENRDTFREESFLRYTDARLDKLEKTPYQALAKCHGDDVNVGLRELQHQTHEKKKSPEFWNMVGMCYFLADHLVKAEYYFQFALDLNQKGKNKDNAKFAPALNNLGAIKLKQGHYEMALDYFKKAADINKGQNALKVPLFNQAQVYLQFNLLKNAQTILEDLNRENRQDPDILLGLGSVYLLQGNTTRSLGTLQQIPGRYQAREDVTLIRALGLYQDQKIEEVYALLKEYDFTQYVPLKKSAQKLKEIVTAEVKKKEEEKQRLELEKKNRAIAADKKVAQMVSKDK